MTGVKYPPAGGRKCTGQMGNEGRERRRKQELDKHGGYLVPLGTACSHTEQAATSGSLRELPGGGGMSLKTCVWELIA